MKEPKIRRPVIRLVLRFLVGGALSLAATAAALLWMLWPSFVWGPDSAVQGIWIVAQIFFFVGGAIAVATMSNE